MHIMIKREKTCWRLQQLFLLVNSGLIVSAQFVFPPTAPPPPPQTPPGSIVQSNLAIKYQQSCSTGLFLNISSLQCAACPTVGPDSVTWCIKASLPHLNMLQCQRYSSTFILFAHQRHICSSVNTLTSLCQSVPVNSESDDVSHGSREFLACLIVLHPCTTTYPGFLLRVGFGDRTQQNLLSKQFLAISGPLWDLMQKINTQKVWVLPLPEFRKIAKAPKPSPSYGEPFHRRNPGSITCKEPLYLPHHFIPTTHPHLNQAGFLPKHRPALLHHLRWDQRQAL